MNDSIMDLSVRNLSFAYGFVLLLMLIFRTRGIRREGQILTAAVRMTVQLTVMGLVLLYVFERPGWAPTLMMLLVMVSFAVYHAKKRVKVPMPAALSRMIGVSLIFGYLVTAGFFLYVVLGVRPWFHPQYVVPISGMIIGNTMTGLVLGANRLCSEMRDRRAEVESALMLGAFPAAAAHEMVNNAFDAAIVPTMNNMLTMGIVSLPGMMTGQILSGTFPLTAIKYQIGIMLAILGCTALSVVLFVSVGYQTFFTKSAALLPEEEWSSAQTGRK